MEKDYPNSLVYSDTVNTSPFYFWALMRVLVSCTTFLYWLNSHNAKMCKKLMHHGLVGFSAQNNRQNRFWVGKIIMFITNQG